MKSQVMGLGQQLSRLPARTVFSIGLVYTLALSFIDLQTPASMSFALFYVLGTAWVGWGAGRQAAVGLALFTTLLSFLHETPISNQALLWTAIWNVGSRCLVLCVVGILTAELGRLNRHLSTLVEKRTAQWRTEAEGHRTTASRLREALELNQQILSASAMGIAAYKASGESVFANEAMARMAETTVQRFMEDNFRTVSGWQTSNVVRLAEQALVENQPRSGEFRATTASGRTVWLDTFVAPFNSAGHPHLLHMCYDITARKTSDELLRTQRDLAVSLSQTASLRTALDCLLGAVLSLEAIDRAGVYLANPKNGDLQLAAHGGEISDSVLKHIAEYPVDSERARLIRAGKPVYEIYERLDSWHDAIRDTQNLRAMGIVPLMHEGTAVGCLVLASQGRDWIPTQSRVAIEALAAQIGGAIVRIRAEEALAETQDRLHTIITGVPIILFAVDQEGLITFEDGQALLALGACPGQHVGQKVVDAYGQFPQLCEQFSRAMAGEQFSAPLQLGSVSLDCWYSPSRTKEGANNGYIGVATDVTDHRRLERHILEISDHEQARIGQEIHDGLCQQLVSLAFDANALDQQLSRAGRPESVLARRIADYLDAAITEARQLSRGLFPIRLETHGLSAALEELARNIGERFKIPCSFEEDGNESVATKAMATHLYRIAQEAVANSVRHAKASSIQVSLITRPGQLELRVADDGVGTENLPQAQSRLSGLGLYIMDYRARSLGGTLRLHPGESGGTIVSCCVPQVTG